MSREIQPTTDQNILQAARQVFHQKGLAGARMQEIADKAEINKAMLHYYYKNKEQLFDAVFQQDIQTLLPSIIEVLTRKTGLFDKLRQFSNHYITTIQNNPHLPGFVINELTRNPQRMVKMVTGHQHFNPQPFFDQVRSEVEKGTIKPIDPHQLLVNTVSMCLFPFIGKPMLKGILQKDEEAFWEFIEQRKTDVPEFVIASIEKKQ